MAKTKPEISVTSIQSANFRVDKNNLHFNVRTPNSTFMQNVCNDCPITSACFGETDQHSKSARVNLEAPIVKNMTSTTASEIPCGAGIEIIQRASH